MALHASLKAKGVDKDREDVLAHCEKRSKDLELACFVSYIDR